MPLKPQRPCRAPGCPRVSSSGWCERHAELAKRAEKERRRRAAARRPRGPREYDKRRWKNLRRMKLSNDPMCEGAGCHAPATEVDHKDGDVTNRAMENLRALCKSCHSKKTVRRDGGFGRAAR